jgi:hypothetical protein
MSENINLQKQVFNKGVYSKVINTDFTELGVIPIQQQIETQPTVEDFFNLYNELFYDIPELGVANSHEYLIIKSSEYINFSPNQDEIDALQTEISQLRIELLDTQKQLLEAQTGTSLANPQ